MDDNQKIQQRWSDMKSTREEYKPVWDRSAKFVGITVDPNYAYQNNRANNASDLDQFVDDPTAAISVNQGGDYLVGIAWGNGEKVFDIVPSRYVLELVDSTMVDGWYKFATDQTLYHMNHANAGLITAMQPYAYDQFAFGTSGIGCFTNSAFKDGREDNALLFRNYGVDNTCIDEGKNGMPEIVGAVYHWRTNRTVAEFCMRGGAFDEAQFAKLPRQIRDAYTKGDWNQEFSIVCLVMPREDYDPKMKGARGTKYCSHWFLDGEQGGQIFYTEDHAERPIIMARQIKVRGQIYGRSSGTLLISTIASVNFMMGSTIEIIDKMSNPSLGIFNNAIFGDGVLDTSAEGLTVFNQALVGGSSQAPIFPIHDVGDPADIIKFLIPYLNEKVTTAFKIDALLDFNSAKDMTATESLQRYAIRGKSLSGMLGQQKNEMFVPLTTRAISCLQILGELGIDPNRDPGRAEAVRKIGKLDRVIPAAVLQVMAAGRPWFELKFNNELEKMMRTEAVQNLVQIIQAITAIAALYPDIIAAVDWYKLLKDINDNLDYNNQILISADDFKAQIAALAKQKQMAMTIQAGQAAGQIQKDTSQAQLNKRNASNVGQPAQ